MPGRWGGGKAGTGPAYAVLGVDEEASAGGCCGGADPADEVPSDAFTSAGAAGRPGELRSRGGRASELGPEPAASASTSGGGSRKNASRAAWVHCQRRLRS